MNPAQLKVQYITVGELQTNCYLVFEPETKNCIIVDPGDEGERIEKDIKKKGLNVLAIVNTHGHPDHISANEYLKNVFSCPVYINPAEKDFASLFGMVASLGAGPTTPLKEGQLKIENIELNVIHTPGHTPGGVCLVGSQHNNFVLTGDTLFCGSVGRCDLPGGDETQLMRSLKKLTELPGSYIIYPGHGPQCTIAGELEHNPFVA